MRCLQVASMEQRSPILAVSLLMFAGVTSAWLGISGPIFPDVADKGLYKFLSDWQTLIGAMLQLCAAVVAAWIVWSQLKEQRAQAAIQTIEVIQRQLVLVLNDAALADQLFKKTTSLLELHHWRDEKVFPPDRFVRLANSSYGQTGDALRTNLGASPELRMQRLFLVGDQGYAHQNMESCAEVLEFKLQLDVIELRGFALALANGHTIGASDVERIMQMSIGPQAAGLLGASQAYKYRLDKERDRLFDMMLAARRRAGL
jgi:hypothetical protein